MAVSDNREDLSGSPAYEGPSADTNDRPERENRPFETLVKGVLRQFADEEEYSIYRFALLVKSFDKYQNYVCRVEKKAARKIGKKARKAAILKAKEEKAEMSRAAGEKPPSPCKRCAPAEHWKVDCPKLRSKSRTVHPRKSPLDCGDWRKPSQELNPEPIAPEAPAAPEASAPSRASGKHQRSSSLIRSEPPLKKAPDVNGRSVKGAAKGGQGVGKGSSEKATVVFTQRVEKGFAPEEESIFGDGTWIWAKMPLELRPAANVPLSWALFGLVGTGLVSHAEMKVACHHGRKSWAVKFSLLKTGGARGFVTDHYGFMGPAALMAALLNVQEIQECGIAFWVGIQNNRGAVGVRALVVFERSPGFASFSVPIGEANVGFKSAFRAKFRAMDVDKSVCEIRTLEHPDRTVVQCPELQTFTRTADMDSGCCVVLTSHPIAS
ncbi:hypothetical protein BO78DRAFT_413696 [Aspergillus sclerotiicarbonarius CBS 121057]|uniref:Uncharacterized protein n=1 Tax=Aspergillus sclerotiicarbonarius (strain CBS 121057 / IBT 28362) TaxID=1448318 RepID=A0A319FMZ3_ASPSB|nr:hypothetical protein BO78DRAFT_413696 [Aspergillus sclerotiicarbonarius CBS 121057]